MLENYYQLKIIKKEYYKIKLIPMKFKLNVRLFINEVTMQFVHILIYTKKIIKYYI